MHVVYCRIYGLRLEFDVDMLMGILIVLPHKYTSDSVLFAPV